MKLGRLRIQKGDPAALRRSVLIACVALAVMVGGVSAALIVLTTGLHDATTVLRETVREVRMTSEARLDLVMHERTADPLERAHLELRLASAFIDVDHDHLSPEIHEDQQRARMAIARYLAIANEEPAASPASTAAVRIALEELEPLTQSSVKAADRARERASKIDTLANVIGIGAVVLMLVVVGAALAWTQRAVLRPVLVLSDAMERFGSGDLTARADPKGAAEVRRMMERFNAMSTSLVRQRHARLTHIAGVAHDLRNPLAAMQMSAALVDPERPLPPEPTLRRTLALIRRQVGRLHRMVEDLLDAARIDAGHLELEIAEADLNTLAKDVVALFKDVSPIHTIDLALAERRVLARCDAARVEQILSNLLSNAIKYSPRGGSVIVATSISGDRATVSVTDHGIGIARSEIDELWEPFRRSKGLSTESVPGVGLGLWTAKRIANAHGGDVVVESTLGGGSTFTLELPLARSPEPSESGAEGASRPLSPAASHG